MRRRRAGDNLTLAYVQYLVTWLRSRSVRRRLRQTRRERHRLASPPKEAPRGAR
jgi:hypothetical protein